MWRLNEPLCFRYLIAMSDPSLNSPRSSESSANVSPSLSGDLSRKKKKRKTGASLASRGRAANSQPLGLGPVSFSLSVVHVGFVPSGPFFPFHPEGGPSGRGRASTSRGRWKVSCPPSSSGGPSGSLEYRKSSGSSSSPRRTHPGCGHQRASGAAGPSRGFGTPCGETQALPAGKSYSRLISVPYFCIFRR